MARRLFIAALLAVASFAAAAAPVSVSALMRAAVTNAEGERLGIVRDLAVDVEGGRVAYAIVQLRDPRGTDQGLEAVPLEALRPGLARRQLLRFPEDGAPALLTLGG